MDKQTFKVYEKFRHELLRIDSNEDRTQVLKWLSEEFESTNPKKSRNWLCPKWVKDDPILGKSYYPILRYIATHSESYPSSQKLSDTIPKSLINGSIYFGIPFIPNYEDMSVKLGMSIMNIRLHLRRLVRLSIIKKTKYIKGKRSGGPAIYVVGYWLSRKIPIADKPDEFEIKARRVRLWNDSMKKRMRTEKLNPNR